MLLFNVCIYIYKIVIYNCKINMLPEKIIDYFPLMLLYRMESIASTSMDKTLISEHSQGLTSAVQDSKEIATGVFKCSYCSLEERFDFKGIKAPFSRQLSYTEECYIMKDPFSLPNKGEVLVLGADCNFCKKTVCLECSIYFGKRFCLKCASSNIQNLPSQLHSKIKNLIKEKDS